MTAVPTPAQNTPPTCMPPAFPVKTAGELALALVVAFEVAVGRAAGNVVVALPVRFWTVIQLPASGAPSPVSATNLLTLKLTRLAAKSPYDAGMEKFAGSSNSRKV